MAWPVLILWLAFCICLPEGARAAEASWRLASVSPPSTALAASSSLDAQVLGEKPSPATTHKLSLHTGSPSLEADTDSSSLKFPYDLEVNVSFLYNRENPALAPKQLGSSLPLFNYSMDYRLLPNFKVGLSGYLYYPEQGFSFSQKYGERVMGLGPGLKYDLGRWSFVVKSQVETGTRERGEDFQNWLRVWYVF